MIELFPPKIALSILSPIELLRLRLSNQQNEAKAVACFKKHLCLGGKKRDEVRQLLEKIKEGKTSVTY